MIRNSHIELLKIIGILLIVFSHVIPVNDLGLVSSLSYSNVPQSFDLTYSYLIFVHHLGSIGNYLFIIPSCYFLLRNEKIHFHKVILIIIDTFLVALIFGLIYICQGKKLSVSQYIFNLSPLAIFDKWFVYSYLALYLTHPLLNKLINKMNQKIHLIVVVFCFVIMIAIYVVKFVFPDLVITQLFGLFFIYFIFAYQDKYQKIFFINKDNKTMNILELLISLLLIIMYSVFSPILSNKIPFLYGHAVKLGQIYNPFTLLVALPLFNLVRIKEPYSNKVINFISSSSLFVYIVSENSLYKIFTRPYVFQYCYDTFSFYNPVLFMFVLALAVFVLCVGLGSLYRISLGRLFNYLLTKPYKKLVKQ